MILYSIAWFTALASLSIARKAQAVLPNISIHNRTHFVDQCSHYLKESSSADESGTSKIVRASDLAILLDIQDYDGNPSLPLSLQYQFAAATCYNDGHGNGGVQVQGATNTRSVSVCEDNKVTVGSEELDSLAIRFTPSSSGAVEKLCRGIAPVLERKGHLIYSSSTQKDQHRKLDLLFNSSEECPCVKPDDDIIGIIQNSLQSLENEMKIGSSSSPKEINIFDKGYGSSCERWDMNFHPHCMNEAGEPYESEESCLKHAQVLKRINPYGNKHFGDWCCSSWCIVDETNCARPFTTREDLFRSENVTGEVHISYETCGNINTYGPQSIIKRLNTFDLRVAYPADGSDGYTLTSIDEDDFTRRGGSMYDFMEDLTLTYNISIQTKNISDKSLSRFNSTYTACAHDIGIGEVDLCVGAFWATVSYLWFD